MGDLLAARTQMGLSLAFHIVFAVAGIGMPLLMALAEGMWLRTGDPLWKELCRRWAKGTAILFAVGAVSGTVLSFELGLLWPHFMELAGPIIGMPFSLEGFAFFAEAIFLGVYLYGWDRVSPRAHWLAGVAVCVSGTLSGAFVVTANAWMNQPTGFDLVDGKVVEIRPWEVFTGPAVFPQALHMTLAAFVAVGFGVAGIHAYGLLKQPNSLFHRRALALGLAVGALFSWAQLLSGHHSAQHIAEQQPLKLAAAEAHWETGPWAPALLGGWADEEAEVTRWAIPIPGLLSLMAFNDPRAVVKGLKEVPKEDRPPVAFTHLAFDVMVGCGTVLAGVGALGAWLARKRELPTQPWFLKALVLCGPLGFIAVEAGWMVTELGRQPWVITGILRTEDAVTPMPHLQLPLLACTLTYVGLSALVIRLMRRQVFQPLPERDHAP